jgi:MtN3 and saliva related transmembrane protein
MHGTELIGLCAGLLTTAANVPQVLKTWRERSADGLSRRMLLTLSAGLAVWVWYGLLQHDLPIIVTNLFALLLSTTLLILKRRFDKRSHPERKLVAGRRSELPVTSDLLEQRSENSLSHTEKRNPDPAW